MLQLNDFALFHFSSAFIRNFDSSFGLMFPQRFSDPIARFGYADQETRRDTPHLTVGHTPLSFGCP